MTQYFHKWNHAEDIYTIRKHYTPIYCYGTIYFLLVVMCNTPTPTSHIKTAPTGTESNGLLQAQRNYTLRFSKVRTAVKYFKLIKRKKKHTTPKIFLSAFF